MGGIERQKHRDDIMAFQAEAVDSCCSASLTYRTTPHISFKMTARLVLVIGDLFIPDRAPASGLQPIASIPR